jgi:hypothetical protein
MPQRAIAGGEHPTVASPRPGIFIALHGEKDRPETPSASDCVTTLLATNRRNEQEVRVLCLRILRSALVYVTLMVHHVLTDAE